MISAGLSSCLFEPALPNAYEARPLREANSEEIASLTLLQAQVKQSPEGPLGKFTHLSPENVL